MMARYKYLFVLSLLGIAGMFLALSGLNTPVQAAFRAQLTPLATPTAGPDGKIIYTVQEGDTLFRISAMTGISIEQLRALNNLTSDAVTPGQQLLLGLAAPATPTVPAGPTSTPTPAPPTATPPPGWGVLCVTLCQDDNANAQCDLNESALAGGLFTIQGRSAAFDRAIDTSVDAQPICIQEVAEGAYTVSVILPDGYYATTVPRRDVDMKPGMTLEMRFAASKIVLPPTATPVPPPPSKQNDKSSMLGVLGGGILLIGAGLALAAAVLRKTQS